MTEEYVEVHSATVVCGQCGFVAQLDGGASNDELREVCLQIERIHNRQRHNDTTQMQTTFTVDEAPGRPELLN